MFSIVSRSRSGSSCGIPPWFSWDFAPGTAQPVLLYNSQPEDSAWSWFINSDDNGEIAILQIEGVAYFRGLLTHISSSRSIWNLNVCVRECFFVQVRVDNSSNWFWVCGNWNRTKIGSVKMVFYICFSSCASSSSSFFILILILYCVCALFMQGFQYQLGDFQLRVGKVAPSASENLRGIVFEVLN